MAKSELHRDYILELENELQEFEKKADSATKRMQMLVYPAMVAFFILSAFGFYLIYSLTSDVRRMANTFDDISMSITGNMDTISGTMSHMSGTMDSLTSSTTAMSKDVGKMTSTTTEMTSAITGMKPAIYDMAASTNNMQRDFWSMNKNISTPLSFMNNFLPWKDSQSMPFQGSRAPLPQSYYSYPVQQQPTGFGLGQFPIPLAIPDAYSVPSLPAAPADVTAKSLDQSTLVLPLTSASLN